MGRLRTAESEDKYQALVAGGILSHGCVLCEAKSIKEFEYWRIISNNFPYDLIADVHHMIVPKRHVSDIELNNEEKNEFDLIKKDYMPKNYEYMIEATHTKKSIPQHAHTHLIIAKD